VVGRCRLAKAAQPVTGETSDRPLVSVVIPMYQAEAWILDTLESVAAQTYPEVETIVVDDGSSDSGSDLVSAFAESAERPVYLVRTANQGVAAARNLGIAESNGVYVALLDADDLWHPEKLELQVARLQGSGSPMCTCGYEFFDDRTRRRIGVVRVDDGSAALRGWLALEGNGLALASTALIRRQALDNLCQFDSTFTISADLDFALRVDETGHIDALPEALVGYRVHPGQMHRQISGLAAQVSTLYDIVFADGRDPSFERRCRANLAVHIGLHELLRGRMVAAIPHLYRSVRRDPRRIVTLPLRACVRRSGRYLRAVFAGETSW
jgi:glycosyltransferase involved in cell wall biosynthesis